MTTINSNEVILGETLPWETIELDHGFIAALHWTQHSTQHTIYRAGNGALHVVIDEGIELCEKTRAFKVLIEEAHKRFGQAFDALLRHEPWMA